MTAVEWLAEVVAEMGYISTVILEQAKEMEKRQIIDSFNKGFITDQWDKSKENKAEQYYNETFKSE
jgi:hypothetical protein